MAKKAYTGVNNVARQVKKIYVGVNNVARKVKKGYVGVNNIARCFFGRGETVVYHGVATSLSVARRNPAAASTTKYMFFGCGESGNATYPSSYEAYNESLTHTMQTVSNGYNVEFKTGTATTNYFIFTESAEQFRAVSNTLTHSTIGSANHNSGIAGPGASTATLANKAFFIGRGERSSEKFNTGIMMVDNSLTIVRGSTDWSAFPDFEATAANIDDDYIISCRGLTNVYNGSYYQPQDTNVCFFITPEGTFTKTTIPYPSYGSASTGIDGYALVGGGITVYGSSGGQPAYANVYAFDSSLTRTELTSLTQPRGKMAATTLYKSAIFSGGYARLSQSSDSYTLYATTDLYDTSLTKTQGTSLSAARYGLGATSLGDFALVAGGSLDTGSYSYTDSVEAYTLI